MSVRERNRRVAIRVGATVAFDESDAPSSSTRLIIVPPQILLEPAFFDRVPPGRSDAADLLNAFDFDQASGAAFNVSTGEGCRRAENTILERTGKTSDGWVARHWNRPISRRISGVLLSMGFTPWHASMLTLVVGVLAALLAIRPGYAALVGTGLLFQLASVLDGVDGEMARATLAESEAGARLDTLVDHLTYVACFVGVGIGWVREGVGSQALWWTLAILVALAVSIARGARFVSRHAPEQSGGAAFVNRALRRAARDSGRPALWMVAMTFEVIRRDLFAVVFLVVALLGQRVLIPGLVAGGIVLTNAAFTTYRRELSVAAMAEARAS
jgi:CDP-L-myo-inositol myo-inositolphosphotransferase